MNILIVATTMGMGGAEKQISDLVNNFVGKGHCITILALKGDFHFTFPDNVELIKVDSAKNALGFLKSIYSVVKATRRIRPDIVHGHMATANFICRAARLFSLKTPLICTAHSVNEGGGKIRMWLYRITDFLSTITTNVSVEAVEHYIEHKAAPAKKIIPVYNGIDLNIFNKSSLQLAHINGLQSCEGRHPVLLNVARLVDAKDHDNLLRAFSLLKARYPNAVLLIAGDGPLKQNIADQASSLQLSNDVLLLGTRKDIAELMSISDIFVLSSAWEGFGLVLAEAMACDLPVVSTDCGGTREVVNGHGFMVPTKNPQALSEAITKTLVLDEQTLELQKNTAKQSIQQRFDIDLISNVWLALYKKLAPRHKQA